MKGESGAESAARVRAAVLALGSGGARARRRERRERASGEASTHLEPGQAGVSPLGPRRRSLRRAVARRAFSQPLLQDWLRVCHRRWRDGFRNDGGSLGGLVGLASVLRDVQRLVELFAQERPAPSASSSLFRGSRISLVYALGGSVTNVTRRLKVLWLCCSGKSRKHSAERGLLPQSPVDSL